MAKSTLNIGQELHGDSIVYRIEAVLGQGSFGITYKAKAFTVMKGKFGEELVETNTPKAIKEFFMKEVNERDESGSITGMSEGSLSYNYAQKFKKEAENLAGMNHPNIVKVIDFITANNTYYYVMDYIEGENLNEYLKHHKMTEQEATNTIKEVAKALKYMHEEMHMLHLDLKPGNIMRRKSDGHIFLIDFGLSKHYSEEGIPETSTSVGLGTPGYAPIEQSNSKNAKLFRATLDVYALGATFYKLLTGNTPPSADELVSDENIIKSELSKYGIKNSLVSIVVQAMKPSVKERTQNIKALIVSLNEFNYNTSEATVNDANNENTIIDTSKTRNAFNKKSGNGQTKGRTKNKAREYNKQKESEAELEQEPKQWGVQLGKWVIQFGDTKTIIFLIALCLFIIWKNFWPSTPKEEIVSPPAAEQNVNSPENSLAVTPTHQSDSSIDNNSLESQNFDGFHSYRGYFIDSEGKYPVELSFNLHSDQFSDCVYKNVTFGGKIKMKGNFEDNLIVFRGKDGNNDFIMELGLIGATGFNLKGKAKDGAKVLDVELYEKQN